jgi:DNA-binding CsgD family transcriptional regulator
MEPLTAGLVAEIACSAPSWSEVERVLLGLLWQQIGADAAFFAGSSGFGEHTMGVLAPLREEVNAEWSSLFPSVDPAFRAAAKTGGVIIDSEVFGKDLERFSYYDRIMRRVRGTTTLIAFLSRDGRFTQKIGLGRVQGNRPFGERDRALLASLVPTLTLAYAALEPHAPPDPIWTTRFEQLTARERQVVSYLAHGYTNEQIGVALGTRPRTIRNQLSSAYEKLGVASRAEAVGLLGKLGSDALD